MTTEEMKLVAVKLYEFNCNFKYKLQVQAFAAGIVHSHRSQFSEFGTVDVRPLCQVRPGQQPTSELWLSLSWPSGRPNTFPQLKTQ